MGSMLADLLKALGYKPTLADQNVWIKPGTKPDGFKYYQMILVYVDDILHLSHDTDPVIKALQASYTMKEGSIGTPKHYLGANVAISPLRYMVMASAPIHLVTDLRLMFQMNVMMWKSIDTTKSL